MRSAAPLSRSRPPVEHSPHYARSVWNSDGPFDRPEKGVAGVAMVEQNGKRPVAALFDVDGTLVDTNYLHVVTWWEAFAQAGFEVQMAQIHRAIGMGSDQMLDKLLPADRDEDADAEVRAAHSALYSVYWSRLRPLPGAADLLRACKRRGLAVVLASSGGRARVQRAASGPRRGGRDRRGHLRRGRRVQQARTGPGRGCAGQGRRVGRGGGVHR